MPFSKSAASVIGGAQRNPGKMLNEIDDQRGEAPRRDSVTGSLGREILTDVVMTSIGTGLVLLAIVLTAQGLRVS